MNFPQNLGDKNPMGLITLRSYKETGKNLTMLNNSVRVGETNNNIFN